MSHERDTDSQAYVNLILYNGFWFLLFLLYLFRRIGDATFATESSVYCIVY